MPIKYVALNKSTKNVLVNVLSNSVSSKDESLNKKEITNSIKTVVLSDKFKYLNDTNINKQD